MKRCSKCAELKPLSGFNQDNRSARLSRGGQGVTAVCKVCLAEARKPGIHAERELEDVQRRAGLKHCSACDEWKSVETFSVRRASPDGLAHRCKACICEYKRRYDLANPGAYKDWYQDNKERRSASFAAWREKNKDRLSAKYKAWAAANKDKVNALIAKRTARKRAAIASWIDEDAVRKIYARANQLTTETGIRHEVDHIIPLQHELVCGLHWEGNLQVLTKAENIRKKNRFTVGAAA